MTPVGEAAQPCVFERLLGDTLRPGGMELTSRAVQFAGISGGNVLEIGCGKGVTARFLARERGCTVTGIDLSPEMISFCRNHQPSSLSFVLGDAGSLPFADRSFDSVVSECSLCLIPDRERVAAEIFRVLKEGGRLVVADIVLKGEVSDAVRQGTGFACCLAGAVRVEELVAGLERAGFRHAQVEDHSLVLKRLIAGLATEFGDLLDLADRLPTGPCATKVSRNVAPTRGAFTEFVRQGKPGYAIVCMEKEHSAISQGSGGS